MPTQPRVSCFLPSRDVRERADDYQKSNLSTATPAPENNTMGSLF